MPIDCPSRSAVNCPVPTHAEHPASPFSAPTPILSIDPPAEQWAALLKRNTSPRAARFRGQLGLPTDRPIIMSGHQAQVWHPGILSKYLAASAGAQALAAHPVWLVVDQDTGEPTQFRYAIEGEDGGRRGGACDLSASPNPDTGARSNAPTGLRPATPIALNVPTPLHTIASALTAHQDAGALSAQIHASVQDLLAPIAGPIQSVSALSISRTDLFSELVERMRADPGACQEAYNLGVASVPRSGVRPLRPGDERSGAELPLWSIRGGVRRPASASDLDTLAPEELAPRGLMMTGLVRMAGCDLFIHGLGGGVYDRVTDAWLARWIGERSPAPSVVVSATLRPGGEVDLTDVDEADALAWRAHAARHNPALLGDEQAAHEKARLLDELRSAPPERRAELYRQLHALLARVRDEHRAALAALDADAAQARARAASARKDAQLARDRTLAFPLYPQRDLLALRSMVRGAFGLKDDPSPCTERC